MAWQICKTVIAMLEKVWVHLSLLKESILMNKIAFSKKRKDFPTYSRQLLTNLLAYTKLFRSFKVSSPPSLSL